MANGVNRVILVGNLGADPDLRTIPSGKQVAEFSLATSRRWNDKEGQLQQSTEWHKIVVWDRMAALCHQYLQKGRQVYIEGRLQTEKWTDREGRDRWTTKVIASQVIFLGNGQQATGMAPQPSAPEVGDRLPF